MDANYRELLNRKGLSNDDKQLIQAAYLSKFGREMRLKSTKCRDCYNDALMELINSEKKQVRSIMFNGRLIHTK